jgi:hypothetical protein
MQLLAPDFKELVDLNQKEVELRKEIQKVQARLNRMMLLIHDDPSAKFDPSTQELIVHRGGGR